MSAQQKETTSHKMPVGEFDPTGRLDVLISDVVRQVVVTSQHPVALALYGRYSKAFDTLVNRYCGPIELEEKKPVKRARGKR